MSIETMRKCRSCQQIKSIDSFGTIHPEKIRRRICGACEYQKRRSNAESYSNKLNSTSKWKRDSRRSPEKRASFIRCDMVKTDRLKGFPKPDIEVKWIDKQLEQPCSYCKQQLDKTDMTLDRIDNAMGHIKSNLTPACRTCNYFRRDMPYEAWIIIAENMQKVVEMGLLKGWSAGGRLRGQRKIDNEINNC